MKLAHSITTLQQAARRIRRKALRQAVEGTLSDRAKYAADRTAEMLFKDLMLNGVKRDKETYERLMVHWFKRLERIADEQGAGSSKSA